MTFTWHGKKVSVAVRKSIMEAVVSVAHAVRTDAINSITGGQKSGLTYKRRGIVHIASAPGEAPAADTGTLHNSIEVVLRPATLSARVNASTAYAAGLEFGNERIEARPFLRPALEKNIHSLHPKISALVKRVT